VANLDLEVGSSGTVRCCIVYPWTRPDLWITICQWSFISTLIPQEMSLHQPTDQQSTNPKIHAVWNVTMCGWVNSSSRFTGQWCLQNVGNYLPNDTA